MNHITVNDIKAQADKLNQDKESHDLYIKQELFSLYKSVPAINALFDNLSDCEKGEYTFDDNGQFIYMVKVPNAIAELPLINDYLTNDCYFLPNCGHHNTLYLASFLGQPITVNYSADRNSYYVYDNEERKAIIKNNENWMTDEYISAKIEEYQENMGVFSYVVVIDRNGGYESSLDTQKHLGRSYKSIIAEYETLNGVF